MAICLNVEPQLKRLGKSRRWLARTSGVARSTIQRHQQRRAASFEFAMLDKLCRALRCRPGDILLDDRAQGL